MNANQEESTERPEPEQSGLTSASFQALLFTQLLTAVNDNIFRWLVIGVGKDFVEPTQVAGVLTAGTICFVAPYLLLAAPAGYLADRFSKRSVIVGCKVAEIMIMTIGLLAIWAESIFGLFSVVFLMGAQSALFSPAKLGSIPEMLRSKFISKANGLFGLTTVSATVIGMGIGNWLSDQTGYRGTDNLLLSASVLLGVAVIGTLVSLAIRQFPAADPSRRFPWNSFSQTIHSLKSLSANRPLMRVALGIVFFWSIGALAQLNIDQFAWEGGAVTETAKVPLLFALVCGVGLGSVLAGLLSGDHVELGILPLGALGIVICSALLFTVHGTIILPSSSWTLGFVVACVLLFGLGLGAGLFSVPLEAYLQHHSPQESRGSILAASNFMTNAGMLLASIVYFGLSMPRGPDDLPWFNSRQVFLLASICTIPVLVYIVWLIPQASIRFLVWLASRTVYRVRVYGRENLPSRGGALLVPNHVSWVDGVLLLLTSSRPIRMIVYAGNFENRFLRWVADLWGAIMIGSKPKMIARALRTAREALNEGELVCIFAEGAITRSGQLQSFKPGLMKILKGTNAPVVPVYLDGMWGSIFSFERGRFFWKWPRRWPYPMSIYFGESFTNPADVHRVRRSVESLGATAVRHRARESSELVLDFILNCRRRRWSIKVADSMGAELTGGSLLTRTLILRRLLRRHVLADDEKHVALLLPPTAGGVVANMSMVLDRRVSANLNYTVSSEVMNECIRQAGIRHVLTSRKFMEKMDFELDAEVVYLDDLRDKLTLADKIVAALQSHLVPARMLVRSLGAHQTLGDEVLTLIFTSGSTGTPKGVMLTQANIASQVDAIEQVVKLTRADVLVGVLPFFHSFGYTITLWTPMAIDMQGVYHFNPNEGRQVGKLCGKYGGTILLATPTFLRYYLRRCEKEQMAKLEVVVTGAEKLPIELCDAFEEKFGVRPVEGYGATELSPLVSVNIPPARSAGTFDVDLKERTVGRPVPGVSAKVVDLDSGEELGADQPGMLLVTGPNVMKGYLGRDDLTAEVIQDGWYITGDVAQIDSDGFIQITGRQSRFSKIGGEMVPHIKIEETLTTVIGASEEDGLKAAVTAVPDSKKGERLIVVHTTIEQAPEQLRQGLVDAGLPNLFIPSADSFFEVDELPLLGSGKLDLKGIQQLALERVANNVSSK